MVFRYFLFFQSPRESLPFHAQISLTYLQVQAVLTFMGFSFHTNHASTSINPHNSPFTFCLCFFVCPLRSGGALAMSSGLHCTQPLVQFCQRHQLYVHLSVCCCIQVFECSVANYCTIHTNADANAQKHRSHKLCFVLTKMDRINHASQVLVGLEPVC